MTRLTYFFAAIVLIGAFIQPAIGHADSHGAFFKPGDIFIHNETRYGNIHNADFSVIMPIFAGDTLLCFAGCIVHEGECGATEPLRSQCAEETGACAALEGAGEVGLGGVCDSDDDCVEGDEQEDPSNCECHAAGGPRAAGPLALLAAIGGLAMRRRSRTPRARL